MPCFLVASSNRLPTGRRRSRREPRPRPTRTNTRAHRRRSHAQAPTQSFRLPNTSHLRFFTGVTTPFTIAHKFSSAASHSTHCCACTQMHLWLQNKAQYCERTPVTVTVTMNSTGDHIDNVTTTRLLSNNTSTRITPSENATVAHCHNRATTRTSHQPSHTRHLL